MIRGLLQNIFLPEKIGSYVLFSKRIIGLDVHRTHIYATVVRLNGKKTTVEQVVDMPIGTTTDSFAENASLALKELMIAVKKVDEVRIAIPSSQVVFKLLRLPFATYEKIKMVVAFEVEPLLPFSLGEAVLDFIIVDKTADGQSAEVLVAAMQKSALAEHLSIFESAGIKPKVAIVDLFGLYGLIKSIPQYASHPGLLSILDLGLHTTQIGQLHEGKLKGIRALPLGILSAAKKIGAEVPTTNGEMLDQLLRFGIKRPDNKAYETAVRTHLTQLLQSIQLTLASFAARTTDEASAKGVFKIVGQGALIPGMSELIFDVLGQPCEVFNPQLLEKEGGISFAPKLTIPSTCVVSLGCALPTPVTQDFNLLRGNFERADEGLLLKQIITTTILSIALLATLFTSMFLQVGSLKEELASSESEVLTVLKERFKGIEEGETNVAEAIEMAEEELKREQDTWSKFSDQAKSSYLRYLLELTNRIDAPALGFEIERLTMSDNNLTLKARVKDHEALKKLEHELRQSELFSMVEPQNDPDFEMQITLKRSDEESA